MVGVGAYIDAEGFVRTSTLQLSFQHPLSFFINFPLVLMECKIKYNGKDFNVSLWQYPQRR